MIPGMASRQGRTAFQVLWFGVKGSPAPQRGEIPPRNRNAYSPICWMVFSWTVCSADMYLSNSLAKADAVAAEYLCQVSFLLKSA